MSLIESKIMSFLNRKQVFVEVNLSENSLDISYIIVKNNKGSLSIESKASNIESFSELQNILPKNTPAHYVFTGHGILFRILENSDNLEATTLIEDAFNTLDLNTVYYSIVNQGDTSYLSIIRKEKLNEIINELKKNDLHPTTLSFGSVSISNSGKYLDDKNASVELSGVSFNFQEGKLMSFQNTDNRETNTYSIGGDLIDSEYIVAFSLALVQFTGNIDTQSCQEFNALNQNLFEDVFYSQIFNIGWKSAIALLFAVLLINFFLFDSLNKRNNELLQSIYHFEKGRDIKNQKDKQSKEELKIYTEFGFFDQHPFAMYVDELSNSLVKGMSFYELVINPKITSKTKKVTTFEQGRITIEGSNVKNSGIDLFEDRIKSKEWVKSTNLKSVSRKGSNKTFHFKLDVNCIK